MTYRKNIDLDERRLRELARSLNSESFVTTKIVKPATNKASTIVKRHELATPKIMFDCIKLLLIASVILSVQVTLSLTIF